MCNLALLPKVALIMGPFDDAADYDVIPAWIVDEEGDYVMYAEDETVYFTKADKLRDTLYVASPQANTVDFYVDSGREPVAIIAEFASKLRNMSALELMRELVHTPGDHAIYYR